MILTDVAPLSVVDEPLTLAVRRHDGKATVQLQGELDLASGELLRTAVERLLESGVREFVLDLSSLALLDASGVPAVVRSVRAVERRRGAAVVAVGGNEGVVRALRSAREPVAVRLVG